MQYVDDGNHGSAFRFLTIAKEVTIANSRYQRLESAERNLRDRLKAITFSNLACFYKTTGRHNLALQYCRQVLEIESQLRDASINVIGHPVFRRSVNIEFVATTHLNMCSILSSMQRHREALKHAELALRFVGLGEVGSGAEGDTPAMIWAEAGDEPAGEKENFEKSLRTQAYYSVSLELEALDHAEQAVVMLAAAHTTAQVRQTPCRPRSWANLSH